MTDCVFLYLFLTSTILHQLIHFGGDVSGLNYPDDLWGHDAGKQFENQNFGGDVNYDLAADKIFFVKI